MIPEAADNVVADRLEELYWGVVKELNFSYYIGETLLFIILWQLKFLNSSPGQVHLLRHPDSMAEIMRP